MLITQVPSASPRVDTASDAATVDTILRLEREWEKAIKAGDQAAIDRIVAADCVFVSSTGQLMSKTQAHIEHRNRLAVLAASTIKEIKVRVFGNTSIVVGLTREVGKSGELTVTQHLWTHVFVRQNDRWQVVSSQSTRRALGVSPKNDGSRN